MTTTQIRTLIVDDEPLARNKIRLFLKTLPNIEIAGECSNGLEAVEAILREKPDLVFLDIQMPEMDGFGVIRTIGVDQMPLVIFITAYDQFAIKAFENHAFDYLLKPFSSTRFVSAVERAMQTLRHQPKNEINAQLTALLEKLKDQDNFIERVVIKTTQRIYFIKVDEIDWIEASGNYVEIHTPEETHLLRETMNHLEKRLDPSKFLRIHRSTLVNIDKIKEMKPGINNDYAVILKNGQQLIMSRRQREKLKKVIGTYL